MSRSRPSKQPINPKNCVYSRVDLHKMYAPQLERGWWHGIPKWPDVYVGSGTCCIPRKQCGFVMILTFTVLAASAVIGGDIPAIAEDHAPESRVFKDLTDRNCDAVQPIAVFTPSGDGADASANSVLAAMTEQWIRNGAKNVVCQQMSRSMQKLSLGWR